MKSGKIIALSTVGTVLALAGGTAWWLRPRWEPMVEMRQGANEAGPLLAEAKELGLPTTTSEFYPNEGNPEFAALWSTFSRNLVVVQGDKSEGPRVIISRSTYEERVDFLHWQVDKHEALTQSILAMTDYPVWDLNHLGNQRINDQLRNMVLVLMTSAQLDAVNGDTESVTKKIRASDTILAQAGYVGATSDVCADILASMYRGMVYLVQLDPKNRTLYLETFDPKVNESLVVWNTVYGRCTSELDRLRFASSIPASPEEYPFLTEKVDRNGLPLDEAKRARCTVYLRYAIGAAKCFDSELNLVDRQGLLDLTQQLFPVSQAVRDATSTSALYDDERLVAPPIELFMETNQYVKTKQSILREVTLWIESGSPTYQWETSTENPLYPGEKVKCTVSPGVLEFFAPIPEDNSLRNVLGDKVYWNQATRIFVPYALDRALY